MRFSIKQGNGMMERIYFVIVSVQYSKLGKFLPSISFLSERENKFSIYFNDAGSIKI